MDGVAMERVLYNLRRAYQHQGDWTIMTKLPKYTLSKDQAKNDWVLKEDGGSRAKRRFATKSEATEGGVLENAVGNSGGSVKIKKEDGQFQEERTYPRSADPKSSPG